MLDSYLSKFDRMVDPRTQGNLKNWQNYPDRTSANMDARILVGSWQAEPYPAEKSLYPRPDLAFCGKCKNFNLVSIRKIGHNLMAVVGLLR